MTLYKYIEKNPEYFREYNKMYYQNNVEYYKAYAKKYNKNNADKIKEYKSQKMTCECGKTFNITNKIQHQKTKIHEKLIEKLNNINIV